MKKMLVIFFISLFLNFCFYTDNVFSQSQPQIQISKDKALQYAKPKKPIKIKLKRDKKGEYSWEITGESVDEVIRADKKIRQLLGEE